jgi:ABC-type amino acid transport substrate-binding protein
MEALSDGEIDVFVYDKPIMNYLITKNELENRVRVMPITFNRNYCSFMLPNESEMVHNINPILLDKISISSWTNTLEKYNLDLGE